MTSLLNTSNTLKKLQAIEKLTQECSNICTPSDFSNSVLETFCKLTDANYGILALLRPPEKQLYLRATYGLPEDFIHIYNEELKFNLNSMSVNERWPSVKSILNKKLIMIKDSNHSSIGFSQFFQDSINPHQIRAVASIPLIINNEVIGVVTKYYTKPHHFDDEEISFIRTTANIITSTLEKNKLIETIKKSEDDLAKANRELKETNEELDSFVYIASHDLREPLRTIESFIEILNKKLKGRLEKGEINHINRITRSAQRMRLLIQDLTELSRAGQNAQDLEEEINLKKLLLEVKFELAAMLHSSNAKVICKGDLPQIRGIRSKVMSIFKNLISNGIKFNNSECPEVDIYKVEKYSDLNNVCLCFEDNGIGIKEKHYKKVFNLFTRLYSDEEFEGTGAGLAIVKKIIEKSGGNIWLDSEEGIGSKFYVVFRTV